MIAALVLAATMEGLPVVVPKDAANPRESVECVLPAEAVSTGEREAWERPQLFYVAGGSMKQVRVDHYDPHFFKKTGPMAEYIRCRLGHSQTSRGSIYWAEKLDCPLIDASIDQTNGVGRLMVWQWRLAYRSPEGKWFFGESMMNAGKCTYKQD